MEAIYSPKVFDSTNNLNLEKYFAEHLQSTTINDDCELDDRSIHNTIVTTLKLNPLQEQKTRSVMKFVDPLLDDGNSSTPAVKVESLKYINQLRRFSFEGLKKTEPNTTERVDTSVNPENLFKSGQEFAVAIRVYLPFGSTSSNDLSNSLKFSHEIVALGSNTLAEFRDKILCHKDQGMCIEVEHMDTANASSVVKDLYPSGFIFIDNVFYNDRRHNNSIDYSEVIREWAVTKNIGQFKTKLMENTKISDLKPRFGYPYVYQHQANCEHIITFSDSWLLNSRDVLNRSCYPLYSEIQRFYSKLCTICYVTSATWVCIESDRLPHRNTFLCQDCFTSYSFKNSAKIGEFKAYPFYDRSRLS